MSETYMGDHRSLITDRSHLVWSTSSDISMGSSSTFPLLVLEVDKKNVYLSSVPPTSINCRVPSSELERRLPVADLSPHPYQVLVLLWLRRHRLHPYNDYVNDSFRRRRSQPQESWMLLVVKYQPSAAHQSKYDVYHLGINDRFTCTS